MALTDRKIPILTGINDTPSTTGQPKHPNASLLCKQYNDLIDNELTALQSSIQGNSQLSSLLLPKTTEQTGSSWYVNADTGSDTTGDGTSGLPFATIQKAIDVIVEGYATNWVTIYCSGTFTNPTFDLSRFDSRKFNLWWDGNPYFQIMGDTNFVINITTKYNNLFTFNPFYKQTVYLGYCTINATQPLILKDYNNFIYLNNVTFNATATNDTTVLFIDNCKQVVIESSSFTKEVGSTIWAGVCLSGHTQAFVTNLSFDVGTPAFWLYDGSRLDNDYQSMTISGSSPKIAIDNSVFATSQSNFTRSDFTIAGGGLAIVNGQIFTSKTPPVIANADTGTEITTINAILTALRQLGITTV